MIPQADKNQDGSRSGSDTTRKKAKAPCFLRGPFTATRLGGGRPWSDGEGREAGLGGHATARPDFPLAQEMRSDGDHVPWSEGLAELNEIDAAIQASRLPRRFVRAGRSSLSANRRKVGEAGPAALGPG